MQKLYVGKTKDVFEIEEKDGIGHVGKFVMEFKDSSTGYYDKDGKPVFDSGYDKVVGEKPGKGLKDCKINSYFFSLLKEAEIPNHFIKDLDERRIIVEPAKLFSLPNEAKEFEGSAKLNNLEIVFRNNVYGSLWRRHPHKIPGTNLDALIEIYSKGLPDGEDILMRDDTLIELGIIKREEIEEVKSLTRRVNDIMYTEFADRELHLIDGKIEVGKRKSDGKIMVIDEISTSVFRACKGFSPDEEGNCTIYKDCIVTSRKPKKSSVESREFGIKINLEGKPETTIIAKNLLSEKQVAEAFGFEHD